MKNRIASIDIFRALTMLLMIFVNDLWTLHGIPGWLEHTEAREDGMGLADVVFPAFLFIVGLSIPFAVKARLKQGATPPGVFVHIVKRSLALIVMGFFMVNHENMGSSSVWLQTLWPVLMIIAFILIWNDYNAKKFAGIPVRALQFTGVIILVALAVIYKAGTPEDPQWMRPHWWGILGLIGWAYFLCAGVYLLTMKRLPYIVMAVIVFYSLNVLEFIPLSAGFPKLRLIVSASNYALVMSGVLATVLYIRHIELQNSHPELPNSHPERSRRALNYPLLLILPALVLLVFGFAVRPMWGISKIMATPSWTAICASISYFAFAIIYLVADVFGKSGWAAVIMPAGRSTLTCYLLPGLVYPFLWPLQQMMPATILGGITGLIKSFLFALLIIWLTGLLEKINVKLKI